MTEESGIPEMTLNYLYAFLVAGLLIAVGIRVGYKLAVKRGAPDKETIWIEMLTENTNKRASAMRFVSLVGSVAGCAVLILLACGLAGKYTDAVSVPLGFLFAGVYGGKAIQSHAEKSKSGG